MHIFVRHGGIKCGRRVNLFLFVLSKNEDRWLKAKDNDLLSICDQNNTSIDVIVDCNTFETNRQTVHVELESGIFACWICIYHPFSSFSPSRLTPAVDSRN